MVEGNGESSPMRIGELSRRCGIPAKTIRYYEGRGLLPAPQRTESGYRAYDDSDVQRLDFVAKAKTLGFSLGEIADILRASDDDAINCDHVLALLRAKRDQIDTWIREAQSLRDALDRTIAYSGDRIAAERSRGRYCCPVIERGLHERAVFAGTTGA